MTVQEFSHEFDIIYNNIMSNQAPGLTEYEKSVFLTKAQDELLKNYFNKKGNQYQEGIDGSPKRHMDFSNLIVTASPVEYTSPTYIKYDDRSVLYTMPEDILLILNETGVSTANNVSRRLSILPISYMDYEWYMQKPFKQPYKNQGWRLLHSSGEDSFVSEIIIKADETLSDYKIRYLKRPQPIILADLTVDYDGVSISGQTAVSECELDPIIHPEILQRATEIARVTYDGTIEHKIALGKRSE